MVVPALGMAVAALLWPFNLYLPKPRQLRRFCVVISDGFTYLLSRLQRILADELVEEEMERWEWVVRLTCDDLLTWRSAPVAITFPY